MGCRLALVWSAVALAFSTSAFAVQGQCDESSCVAFEVTVRLDSYVDIPIVRINQHAVSLGESVSNYDSVVTRAGDTCTKQVKVPVDVYSAITAIMRGIAGTNGEPPPVLTPSQQTMVLFYTTLMQQTLGFTCSPRDLQSGIGNGSNGGTGSNGAIILPASNVIGFIELARGKPAMMVNENGSSRTVQIGETLLGGWQLISINFTQALIRRGSETRALILGSTY